MSDPPLHHYMSKALLKSRVRHLIPPITGFNPVASVHHTQLVLQLRGLPFPPLFPQLKFPRFWFQTPRPSDGPEQNHTKSHDNPHFRPSLKGCNQSNIAGFLWPERWDVTCSDLMQRKNYDFVFLFYFFISSKKKIWCCDKFGGLQPELVNEI